MQDQRLLQSPLIRREHCRQRHPKYCPKQARQRILATNENAADRTEMNCHAGSDTGEPSPKQRTEGSLNLPRAAEPLKAFLLGRLQLRRRFCLADCGAALLRTPPNFGARTRQSNRRTSRSTRAGVAVRVRSLRSTVPILRWNRCRVSFNVLRKRNPGGCPRIGVRVVQGVGETLGFEGEIRKHVRSSINPREQCPNLHPKKCPEWARHQNLRTTEMPRIERKRAATPEVAPKDLLRCDGRRAA